MKKTKYKLEKLYHLDPDRVSERFEELYGNLFSQPDRNMSTAFVARMLGYMEAHIERDMEVLDIAVEQKDDDL